MGKAGRPVSVWTEERLAQVEQEMNEYTEQADIPILAEFAYTHDYRRDQLYQHEQLSNAIKKMMNKKEAQLEKMGLMNAVNSTMAVFSLKQLGWRDKQEIEHTGETADAVKGFLDRKAKK